ncbi:hypothetical protein CEXT_443631 [Caerostris extrusa]|uniref:Uncharacterized protein n=1 Tax=Caerostris extrusa TaxID=172846 RepID=A0AAV4S746_CAEEX|nr:hypothetical protein CEXT_443631 [Caerostris extrusa]
MSTQLNPKKNHQRRNLAARAKAKHRSVQIPRKLQGGNSSKEPNKAPDEMKNRSISLSLRTATAFLGGECTPCTDRSTLKLKSPARSPSDTPARARR